MILDVGRPEGVVGSAVQIARRETARNCCGGNGGITVVHPVCRFGVGGLERQMAQILPRLAGRGERHVVIVRGAEPGVAFSATEVVALIRESSAGRDRRWWRTLARHLREQQADVIHLRGLGMVLDGVAAARAAGARAVFSFHGIEWPAAGSSWVRRRMLRAALRRCAARWAVSEAARRWVARRMGMTAEDFDVVRNGVDTAWFSPAASRREVRAALGLPAEGLVVLAVANDKPIKGLRVLEVALRRSGLGGSAGASPSLEAGPVRAVFVGQRAEHADGAGASGGGTASEVWRVGPREDVRAWYRAADVFVLPSFWEGMSNALLEAMSSGLAVIATSAGGTPEVVRDGENGLLVPAGEVGALALALRRLAGNAGLRARLGAAARRTVCERFTIEGAASELGKRYEAVVTNSERRAASSERVTLGMARRG